MGGFLAADLLLFFLDSDLYSYLYVMTVGLLELFGYLLW